MRDSKQLASDERAIEGLPIRLVIALVVGVASLSVMMSVLDGFGTVADDEVDAQVHPEVIDADNPKTVTITVVDEETGQPVSDARVYLEEGTAQLDGDSIKTNTTDENGNVTFTIDPDLNNPNQKKGHLVIDIDNLPNGYKDDQDNDGITVLEN